MIAAVLPLCIALVAAQLLGYRYYRKAQGALFQHRAQEIAQSLGGSVDRQIENVENWMAFIDLAARLPAPVNGLVSVAQSPEEALEKNWPQLGARDPQLSPFLQSALAGELRAFQGVHPLFAELMLTDSRGHLVAATQKPAAFGHGADSWWRQALTLGTHAAHLQGIYFDARSEAYSIDLALPVRSRQGGEAARGVLKAVINVSPLLVRVPPANAGLEAVQEVILSDGRVLTRLSERPGRRVPPFETRIAAGPAARMSRQNGGWMLAALGEGGAIDLAGYAPVRLSAQTSGRQITGATPLMVVVHEKADVVLAPVRTQMFMVGSLGAAFVMGFALAGYYIATRKIIAPIEALRTSARTIAASAKLEDHCPVTPRALPALEQLQGIRTGDELETLARDFAYMAGRVLSYHEQLEAEIRLKTAAIENDLQIAREFQEALMPRAYPRVPVEGCLDAFELRFQHIYRPASSVGGDFFDVLKLGDHRAGIFIADVMGHGARSALVTAILRALLHNLAFEQENPAGFLAALNSHFHEIIRESENTIFVSAFYLVIDTQAATARYASAGHPSPFLANRLGQKEVCALTPGLRRNPALGLFAESCYSCWERPVCAGDIFLLFTDGVHEAFNPQEEEFGLERIRAILQSELNSGDGSVSRAVVEAVDLFTAPASAADDICLVSVEVRAAPGCPAVL